MKENTVRSSELIAKAEITSSNKSDNAAIHVHKFGGSSLATAECINRVATIIKQQCDVNDIIVVSANGKTTDNLFTLAQLAEKTVADNQLTKSTQETLFFALAALQQQQEQLISQLLNKDNAQPLILALTNDISQLKVWLMTSLKEHRNDILALGELWSARLLSALINEKVLPSYCIDARNFLVINNEQNCLVDDALSSEQFQQVRQANKLAIITGYISKDSQGNSCTLGRNGSDYSATIMASLVGAYNVTLWTDVNGIYSADPRIVPSAKKLQRLSNGVAKELGRLGNPVLHAKTLNPLINSLTKHHAHLHVASSFAPNIVGTEIGKFGEITEHELSVTHLNYLLFVRSTSFASKLITKAQCQFSCLCADEKKGFLVIQKAQVAALTQWAQDQNICVNVEPISIIAVVGHNVAQNTEIKISLQQSLAEISIVDIVEGENNHSIIALLNEPCTATLLNNIHHKIQCKESESTFYKHQNINDLGSICQKVEHSIQPSIIQNQEETKGIHQ
ncbi:MAG: hypothetical protein OCD00_01715 [Colwellia sp.]